MAPRGKFTGDLIHHQKTVAPDARLIVGVLGPTASGKTELAEKIADTLDCKILNADAFQMYRGLDIGTAKPVDRSRYLMLDFLPPETSYTVGRFLAEARPLMRSELERTSSVVVAGGSGLYARALLEGFMPSPPGDQAERERLTLRFKEVGGMRLAQEAGLDAASLSNSTLNNPRHLVRMIERTRLPAAGRQAVREASTLKLVLDPPRQVLRDRIAQRVIFQIESGWIEEVRSLMKMGVQLNSPAFRAIGYAELAQCVLGNLTIQDATDRIITRTRRYAKRQASWLRMEPDAVRLEWPVRWRDVHAMLLERKSDES